MVDTYLEIWGQMHNILCRFKTVFAQGQEYTYAFCSSDL